MITKLRKFLEFDGLAKMEEPTEFHMQGAMIEFSRTREVVEAMMECVEFVEGSICTDISLPNPNAGPHIDYCDKCQLLANLRAKLDQEDESNSSKINTKNGDS